MATHIKHINVMYACSHRYIIYKLENADINDFRHTRKRKYMHQTNTDAHTRSTSSFTRRRPNENSYKVQKVFQPSAAADRDSLRIRQIESGKKECGKREHRGGKRGNSMGAPREKWREGERKKEWSGNVR